MAIPEDALRHNAQFLSQLPDKKTNIGVDHSGRLYVIRPWSLLDNAYIITSIFYNRFKTNDVISKSILFGLRNNSIELKENTLKKFKTCGILDVLNDELRFQVITECYESKYQALIRDGHPPIVAESMISIEMSQNSLISEEKRQIIGAIATGERSGRSGSYFIRDRNGNKIALFKPSDEEPYTENNRQFPPALKKAPNIRREDGIVIGTAWKREVSASLLNPDGFFHIPPTYILETELPKTPGSPEIIAKKGSLQTFVKQPSFTEYLTGVQPKDNSFASMKAALKEMKERIPKLDLQKSILFDVLVGNLDRTEGNIFVDPQSRTLTFIDHGECFPDGLTGDPNQLACHVENFFLFFPQADLEIDQDLRNYFIKINIEEITEQLMKQGLVSETSATELKIRHSLLSASLNIIPPLTAFQIASLFIETKQNANYTLDICRQVAKQISPFDIKIYAQQVLEKIKKDFEQADFIETIRQRRGD